MSRKPRNQVAGHYTLVIQPKSRARWKDPQTPEFEPNWMNATSRARLSGTAKAAEALNHDPDSKVTTKNYIAPSVVVYEPLTMDMARAGLQSKDYQPWR